MAYLGWDYNRTYLIVPDLGYYEKGGHQNWISISIILMEQFKCPVTISISCYTGSFWCLSNVHLQFVLPHCTSND